MRVVAALIAILITTPAAAKNIVGHQFTLVSTIEIHGAFMPIQQDMDRLKASGAIANRLFSTPISQDDLVQAWSNAKRVGQSKTLGTRWRVTIRKSRVRFKRGLSENQIRSLLARFRKLWGSRGRLYVFQGKKYIPIEKAFTAGNAAAVAKKLQPKLGGMKISPPLRNPLR